MSSLHLLTATDYNLWDGSCLEQLVNKLFNNLTHNNNLKVVTHWEKKIEQDFVDKINNFFGFTDDYVFTIKPANYYGILEKLVGYNDNIFQIAAALRIMRDFQSLENAFEKEYTSFSTNLKLKDDIFSLRYMVANKINLEDDLNDAYKSEITSILYLSFYYQYLPFYLQNKDYLDAYLFKTTGNGIISAIRNLIVKEKEINNLFYEFIKKSLKTDIIEIQFTTYIYEGRESEQVVQIKEYPLSFFLRKD